MNLRGKKVFGWILVALGVLFFIDSLFKEFSVWRFFGNLWPIILIFLGIYIIVNRDRFGERANGEKLNRFIGELRTDFDGREIGNLDISIFIGELVVDLRKARILPGENRLHISMGMGETVVLIPDDIPAKISSRIFAGELNYDDYSNAGVFPSLNHCDDGYDSAEKKLRLDLDGFAGEMSIRKEST